MIQSGISEYVMIKKTYFHNFLNQYLSLIAAKLISSLEHTYTNKLK